MINAIILAAGASQRMGKPKPLLRFEDKTFLEQIISVLKLSDVDRITVVLGAKAETIKKSIELSGTSIVINEDYERGQLSSLIVAIENAPEETEAILVCLVDNPFITKAVVNQIIKGHYSMNWSMLQRLKVQDMSCIQTKKKCLNLRYLKAESWLVSTLQMTINPTSGLTRKAFVRRSEIRIKFLLRISCSFSVL